MAILEKIGDTIMHVSKDVTQKAKDVSGIAKLKLDIRAKEDFIKEQYMELGKTYYEMKKGTGAAEQAQFDRIDEALEEIEKMKLQILELKKARVCPECGAQAADTAEYCSVCGAKLTVVVGEPKEEVNEEPVEGQETEEINETKEDEKV